LNIEDGNLMVQAEVLRARTIGPKHGLYRSLLANMVQGVSNGFEKTLEIIGVGYRASKKGEDLEILVGLFQPSNGQKSGRDLF
jgi:large subunit ribosomal protein L6